MTVGAGVSAGLPAAVIDSSALMSILLGEAAAPLFMTGLQATGRLPSTPKALQAPKG